MTRRGGREASERNQCIRLTLPASQDCVVGAPIALSTDSQDSNSRTKHTSCLHALRSIQVETMAQVFGKFLRRPSNCRNHHNPSKRSRYHQNGIILSAEVNFQSDISRVETLCEQAIDFNVESTKQ